MPPNPKELERATLMSSFFGLCGTRSISVSTEGLSRLIVGGGHAVPDGEDRENRFHGTGRAKQVSDRRLGRRHGQAGRMFSRQARYGAQFDFVTERCRRAMCVDIVDIGRRDIGAFQRGFHAAIGTVAIR